MALIAVFMGALPFLLGLFYTGFLPDTEKERDNILLHMAAGYVIMFGLFEIAALPLSFMKKPLSLLIGIYGGSLLLLAAASLVLNYKRIGKVLAGIFYAVKNFTLCIWAQFAFIIMQVFVYIRYQYSNADDSFFVASATTSLATDTIFAYDPYTGMEYAKIPARYVLSPFYAFTATVSRATDTHPAIVAHSVFMILFLLLAYAVFALIGRALFDRDMEKSGYFLLVVSALHVFAGYSERTSGLFLLIRLWQGKAILAGILLPMILYLVIRIYSNGEGVKENGADFVLLFLLMAACCMVSSMGVILGAIMLGIFGIVAALVKKNIRFLVPAAACCLPNLLCAGIYLIIR